MKPPRTAFSTGQSIPPVDTVRRSSGTTPLFGISALLLALVLATTPTVGVHADDGYMVMQYQFELSKNPKFSQLNFAYQEGVGGGLWTYYGSTGKPGIVIPLYSTDPKRPGLFNSLDDSPSENDEEGEKKMSAGAVLSTILGVGVLAAYAYATGKCFSDMADSETESAACEWVD